MNMEGKMLEDFAFMSKENFLDAYSNVTEEEYEVALDEFNKSFK